MGLIRNALLAQKQKVLPKIFDKYTVYDYESFRIIGSMYHVKKDGELSFTPLPVGINNYNPFKLEKIIEIKKECKYLIVIKDLRYNKIRRFTALHLNYDNNNIDKKDLIRVSRKEMRYLE